MASPQKFRSSLNGFNREDVVRYLEYNNAKHEAQTNQLRTELDALRQKLEAQVAAPRQDDGGVEELTAQCEALLQENISLKEQLAAAQSQLEQMQAAFHPEEEELAAYRRAERAERIAMARVSQLYDQANGVLADTSCNLDSAATVLGQLAQETMDRIAALQEAVAGGKQVLSDAGASLGALRLEKEEA